MLSPFFDELAWGSANSLDRERFEKLAREKALELVEGENEPVLSTEQESAIDEVVRKATMELLC